MALVRATSLGLAVVAAFIAGIGSASEPEPPPPKQLPLELAELKQRALAVAASTDDPTPDSIVAVPTTHHAALRVAFNSVPGVGIPDSPIWLVEVRGDFTALGAPRPIYASPPRGHILRFTAQRGSVRPGGSSWGLGDRKTDLGVLGPVTQLHP